MSMPLYETWIWEDSGSRTRLILCDDDPAIKNWCAVALEGATAVSLNRPNLIAKFRESGWTTWLILDGSLGEVDSLTGTKNFHGVPAWCLLPPSLTKDEMVKSVIVWSGRIPNGHDFCQWYEKSDTKEEDLRQIRHLCVATASGRLERKEWPKKLVGKCGVLSTAIHGIENVAIPVRIDVGTLESDSEMLKEIFDDNFGALGYLTEARQFSNGKGIEHEIARYLVPLATLKLDALTAILKPFLSKGQIDPMKVNSELKIRSARETAKTIESGTKDVSEVLAQLGAVANALRDLAGELRQVRDAEEKRKAP